MTKQSYIIENDDWDEIPEQRKPAVKLSNSDLPEGLEIIETKTSNEQVLEDIRKAARDEFVKSKHFEPTAYIEDLAKLAEPIVSIGNQTGEGWFLTQNRRPS